MSARGNTSNSECCDSNRESCDDIAEPGTARARQSKARQPSPRPSPGAATTTSAQHYCSRSTPWAEFLGSPDVGGVSGQAGSMVVGI